MSEPRQMRQVVSPAVSAGRRGAYKCYVEADNQLHEIFWEGSSCYPDLDSVDLQAVELSHEMRFTWSESNFVDFGSNAVVRNYNEGDFPIVKVAHPNAEARQQIQHEYNFMRNLAGFPGARVDSKPLADDEGIYGFRMEYLWKIGFHEIPEKSQDVRGAVAALHQKGFCHGDLSPSNVMLDTEGRLVLIDFSFSGAIGESIPAYIPTWVYRSGVFHEKTDQERVDRFFKEKQLE